MAKNREKLAEMLGAKIVGEIPDVGGGAFGMVRRAQLLYQRLTPSQGERPGRPTDLNWVLRPKVPMSEETAKKLVEIAETLSTPPRQFGFRREQLAGLGLTGLVGERIPPLFLNRGFIR